MIYIMSMNLFIIDSLSPFIKRYKKEIINWSKTPYDHYENGDKIITKHYDDARTLLRKYLKKITKLGFNAVTIDDLAHLTTFNFYPGSLKLKIRRHRKELAKVFDIIEEFGVKIFITTDIFFSNRYIRKVTGSSFDKTLELIRQSCETLFDEFPQVAGLVMRIGESDGEDVGGDFKSRIAVKKIKDAVKLTGKLLPIFERENKTLIFRTWTLGAYQCGDLLWNEKTFHKIFDGFMSPNLIISLKFGNADFFRYLNLNKLFFASNHNKIIELQKRREYEGFGEYPGFVGFDYKKYHKELRSAQNVVGINVWCQTGGWSSSRNYTFLKKRAFWNELNTLVTIKIFKDNMSVNKIIKRHYSSKIGSKNIEDFITFLKYSENSIKKILYDKYFAENELFFNKVRVPPLLYVFWDNVNINNFTASFFNSFNKHPGKSIKSAFAAFKYLVKMREIAIRLKLPYNYDFHFDTFRLLAYCRILLYKNESKNTLKIIRKLLIRYNLKYKHAYKFHIQNRLRNSFLLRILIKLFVRRSEKYRFIDRILFSRIVSGLVLTLIKLNRKSLPGFVNRQGMQIATFFKR